MSFEDYYCKYYKISINIALTYTGCRQKAHDIVQDSFIRIYNNKNHIDEYSWITRVIKNSCIDVIRKDKSISNKMRGLVYLNKMNNSVRNNYENLIDLNIQKVSHVRIRECIEHLSPIYKQVIIKFFIEDKSHKQISREMGIAINTSKANLYNGKAQLKKIYGKFKSKSNN